MTNTHSQVLENLQKTPNLKSKIKEILEKRFIYVESIADILATAIYSNQNVILYGPGGHGKSEMVEAVLEGLGLWNRADPVNSATLIQSFGEGLTEDALWGGIDFKKLNSATDPDMVFNIENSFLQYPVAVFEELFDAPAFCLLPLKHTLQAGFLAKSGKSYPMQTKMIIACTNRNPTEIAELGETYRALLERFVLRQEVIWQSYSTSDYDLLLAKHDSLKISNTDRMVLAGLMAECQDSGHCISPRTAMKAALVLMGSARSRSRSTATTDDFPALKHVTGFEHMAIRFEQSITARKAEAEAAGKLQEAHLALEALKGTYTSGSLVKVLDWMVIGKKFFNLDSKMSEICVPDTLYEQREGMRRTAQEYSAAARDRAFAEVRV